MKIFLLIINCFYVFGDFNVSLIPDNPDIYYKPGDVSMLRGLFENQFSNHILIVSGKCSQDVENLIMINIMCGYFSVFSLSFTTADMKTSGKTCNMNIPMRLFFKYNTCTLVVTERTETTEMNVFFKYITFTLTNLILTVDKLYYYAGEKVRITCACAQRFFVTNGSKLTLKFVDSVFHIYNWQIFNKGCLLQVEGAFEGPAGYHEIACLLKDAMTYKKVFVKSYDVKDLKSTLDYTGLGIGLGFVTSLLIMIFICLSMHDVRIYLAKQQMMYYSKIMESDTVRFPSYILNKATSPIQNIPIPGILNNWRVLKRKNLIMDTMLKKLAHRTKHKNEITWLKDLKNIVKQNVETAKKVKVEKPIIPKEKQNHLKEWQRVKVKVLGSKIKLKRKVTLKPAVSKEKKEPKEDIEKVSQEIVEESHVLFDEGPLYLDEMHISGLPYITYKTKPRRF